MNVYRKIHVLIVACVEICKDRTNVYALQALLASIVNQVKLS